MTEKLLIRNADWQMDHWAFGHGNIDIDIAKTKQNILDMVKLCFYSGNSFFPEINNRMDLFEKMLEDDGVIDFTMYSKDQQNG